MRKRLFKNYDIVQKQRILKQHKTYCTDIFKTNIICILLYEYNYYRDVIYGCINELIWITNDLRKPPVHVVVSEW